MGEGALTKDAKEEKRIYRGATRQREAGLLFNFVSPWSVGAVRGARTLTLIDPDLDDWRDRTEPQQAVHQRTRVTDLVRV